VPLYSVFIMVLCHLKVSYSLCLLNFIEQANAFVLFLDKVPLNIDVVLLPLECVHVIVGVDDRLCHVNSRLPLLLSYLMD